MHKIAAILAAASLEEVLHHYTGRTPLVPAEAGEVLRQAFKGLLAVVSHGYKRQVLVTIAAM